MEDTWSKGLTQNAECENHEAGSDEDGPEHVPKDNIVRVRQALLQRMASEIQGQLEVASVPGKCPLCPYRTFKKVDRLQAHIKRYHTKERQYICSGTTQIKVACALFDNDQITGGTQEEPSAPSACLRQSNRSIHPLGSYRGQPNLCQCHSSSHGDISQARNLHYTQGMADIIYQEMLMCNAKCKAVSRPCLYGGLRLLRGMFAECATLFSQSS